MMNHTVIPERLCRGSSDLKLPRVTKLLCASIIFAPKENVLLDKAHNMKFKEPKSLLRSLIYVLSLSCYSLNSQAELNLSTNPETQLKSWKWLADGLDLELVQRTPNQTRGFFLGRGFSNKIANEIGTNCVFQTIVKNTFTNPSEPAVNISLKEWRIKHNDQIKKVKLKETWEAQWAKDKVNKTPRIAFRWATFPTQQSFEPGGDYNWGMISFGLPPKTIFDLHVFWKQGTQQKDFWVKDIQCPEDR